MRHEIPCHSPARDNNNQAETWGPLDASNQKWVSARLADSTFECHYGFPDLGSLAIVNGDSHEALLDGILDCPAYPFFEWEVTPLCDWQHMYDKNIAYFEKLAGS
jgi:hypothetical protein